MLMVMAGTSFGTPAFIDVVLGTETVDTRRRFVSALGAFDGAAMQTHGRAYKDLTAPQQVALLTEASTLAPSAATVPEPEPEPEPSNLRDYFDHLKGWIADIHFSSEAGQRELGWTGGMFHGQFNACGPSGT